LTGPRHALHLCETPAQSREGADRRTVVEVGNYHTPLLSQHPRSSLKDVLVGDAEEERPEGITLAHSGGGRKNRWARDALIEQLTRQAVELPEERDEALEAALTQSLVHGNAVNSVERVGHV
jgi:hypothetical protein